MYVDWISLRFFPEWLLMIGVLWAIFMVFSLPDWPMCVAVMKHHRQFYWHYLLFRNVANSLATVAELVEQK